MLITSSLVEINHDYYNYTSTEKLFAYVPHGVQIGAAFGAISVATMATYIYFPCYQKGSLQTTEIVTNTCISAIVGALVIGAIGAAIGTVAGAAFLVNDFVHDSYDFA